MLRRMMLASDAGPGPDLWTPAALNPKFWMDWDSSVTEVSGTASQWTNSGWLGGAFTNTVSGRRPVINAAAAGVGGRRVLEFDGADDYLAVTGGSQLAAYRNVGSAWAFVIAASRSTGGTNRQIFEAGAAVAQTRFGVAGGAGTGQWRLAARRVDGVAAQTLAASTLANDTDFHVFYAEVDYANAAAMVVLDGGTPDTASPFLTAGNTSDTNSYGLRIGCDVAMSAFAHVSVAAVVSSSGSLPSTADRQRLEGWGAWACGLQSKLPSGHPYKSTPPTV